MNVLQYYRGKIKLSESFMQDKQAFGTLSDAEDPIVNEPFPVLYELRSLTYHL